MRHSSQIKTFINIMRIYLSMLAMVVIIGNCNYKQIDVMPKSQIKINYSYYSNGQLEFSAEYLNGKLDGWSKHWSENGNLISVSQYSNGKLHGLWKNYYSNQNIQYEVQYAYGQKHGKEKWYYENGQLKSEQTFQHGLTQNDIIRWNLDGSIIY